MILDLKGLRNHINQEGIKQKAISEKAEIPESKLSLILQGKRKCEVGEYASICNVLEVPFDMFIKKEEKEVR